MKGIGMDNWIDPIAFHIGSRPVFWYGIFVAAGFLLGVLHYGRLDKLDGRRKGFGSDFAFLVILFGILGGRIAYVIANWPEYAAAPLEVFRIDRGGLIFYGGFILASIAVIVMAQLKKEPVGQLVDYGITAVPLGHALGRVGCFFNGCCYGRPSELPWSVLTAGEHRHPVQVYEAAFNLGLFFLLTWFYGRRKRDGSVLALYMMYYGGWRFVGEFFRGDARRAIIAGGLDVAQGISIGLILIGCALWFFAPRRVQQSHAA